MLKKFFEKVNRQTAPLTFVLSRKGREESKKEYPPHPTPLPRVEREGKILTAPLTFVLSRRGREKKKEKFT